MGGIRQSNYEMVVVTEYKSRSKKKKKTAMEGKIRKNKQMNKKQNPWNSTHNSNEKQLHFFLKAEKLETRIIKYKSMW